MKRLAKPLALILILTLIFALVACGDDDSKSTEPKSNVTEAGDVAGTDAPANVDAPEVDEAILGQYDATSYVYSGTELDTSGEWIKLEKAGRGVFFITGKEYPFSYSLDGETFKMDQDVGVSYEGTFKDGVITLNMPMTVYTFEKK